ncbi:MULTISPECIES: hypothetical protein [Aneurinibacillus]|uniref:Transposase (putative) YhgA-like domain-containing protein n=1 Tax=Aneurinibacillus danicus TaxID=267746 RepID=A0A511VB40_9BACL|nr:MULTISPECIES: hypothetical protein [Aneurinibacillus]GEN36029.1 hypothetical protein ADA01nite_34890 [Aneurinibacillus danicus]
MSEGTNQQGLMFPDYDALWKEVIEEFFEEFLHFFAPDLYEAVDFNKGYEFLEQELRTLFPDSEAEKKYTDKLAKLYLKSGEEKWILTHIEVQGSRDLDFAERMFRYFYRVYDKYDRKIFALALFSDESPSYKPDTYKYEFFDTTLTYTYRSYKIVEQNEEELTRSENPFSMAVLAGLYVVKSKKDINARYQFKINLIRLLLQKEWRREKIEKLFVFIDGLLKLPVEKEKNFEAELNEMVWREGENMGLTWDRSNLADMYYSKGKIEGKIELVKKWLEEEVDADIQLISKISGLSLEDVKKLKKEVQRKRSTH